MGGPAASRYYSGVAASAGETLMSATYFPPLAWQLVDAGGAQPAGLVNVGSWLAYGPDEQVDLSTLIGHLMFDCHPRHKPNGNSHWFDLLNTTESAIIESLDITNSDPYVAAARRRLMQRQLVPMHEVEVALAARGMTLP